MSIDADPAPPHARDTGIRRAVRLLFHFGVEQALCCLFPLFIFLALGLTQRFAVEGLPRYDVLLAACIVMQVVMVAGGWESRDELKVVTVFHLLGLCLEIYKVGRGSWSYPEFAHSKVAGVPLFSGFMYAAVASYMCQSWRRLRLDIGNWPPRAIVIPLGMAIYGNFFTHHFLPDIRWPLIAAVFVIFVRTQVFFTVADARLKMPLAASFLLIGLFIWLAENIATLLGAWQYPNQQSGWEAVHKSKITSWFLLVIVSFIIVAQLKRLKAALASGRGAAERRGAGNSGADPAVGEVSPDP